jgi:DNA primase
VVQQIVRNVDFVRLVGRHVELKKRGKSFWGLCPFHSEKTPSFSVDPDDGLYYCFGCKEGGNVFTFLQKMEGLSFGEALQKLAAEAGVDLSRYRAAGGPSSGELGRLRDVLELATSFYQKCLAKARGGRGAAEYLTERGFTDESVELWRLGYAPDGWEHFLKCAVGRDYEPELLVQAGLARSREGAAGHYDAFRNRLMFPITDTTGRTIGFGARALKPDDEPKYLNSPDTPLFSKGRCFFGLAQARAPVRSADTAVVLEGYTDVIMAHQVGVTEALAVLGTALTEEHARRLSRLCTQAVLVFDADEAGQRSAARSVEVLLNEDLDVRVARLPVGSDPCDYIVEHGGEAFRRCLQESPGFFEFRLELARSRHGTGTVEARSAVLREMAELAAGLREEARREMVVRWVADELGISPRSVWSYLESRTGPRRTRRSEPAGDGRSRKRLSARDALPAELLGLLLANPELLPEASKRLDVESLKDCPESEVLAKLLGDASDRDARDYISSLGESSLAAAASRALAEERRREASIRKATAGDRLEGYLGYLERRKEATPALDGQPERLDDEQLRAVQEKFREKDKKSAERR